MNPVLALPVALMAQAVAPPAWLAGCWQLQAGNRETVEMWMAPAGGLMLGASRTLVNGVLREYEQIVIKVDGGKLVYTASPSGQRTASFTSTAVTDSSFTVENLQHDFPQRIIYRRRGADSLIARIEGPSRDGSTTRGFDYTMGRTRCGGAPMGYHDAWPQWSRDGARLVFASTRDGDWEIYVAGPAGENPTRLTWSAGRDAHPVFLPDGKRIVFQSPRDHAGEGQVDLYMMDVDGANQRRITTAAGFNGVPVPSPNGEWIAFQRGSRTAGGDYRWDLYIVDSTGRRERRLTNQTWSSQVPTWSPDGRELAFYANPAGPDKLFIINLASGAVRPVTAGGTASDNAPAWSPDGRFLAFVSTRDGSRDLYHVELATKRVRRVTRGLSIWAQPSWSPDGQRIIVSAKADGVDRLVVLNAEGS